MNDNWYDELATYLKSRGHSEEEITKIVARVQQHDVATMHDSVMESIADGSFDLAEVIKEALAELDAEEETK